MLYTVDRYLFITEMSTATKIDPSPSIVIDKNSYEFRKQKIHNATDKSDYTLYH